MLKKTGSVQRRLAHELIIVKCSKNPAQNHKWELHTYKRLSKMFKKHGSESQMRLAHFLKNELCKKTAQS